MAGGKKEKEKIKLTKEGRSYILQFYVYNRRSASTEVRL